jgi:hypothetical protein
MLTLKAQTPMDRIITKLRGFWLGKDSNRVAAVAAYEDSPTDARVNEFCRALSRQLGPNCEVTRQMWLLNELRAAPLRAIAAAEAARADLIIIAVHHAQAFPAELKSWIKLWLGLKGKRPIVLLGLFDPAYQGDSTSLQTYLDGVSKRGKMEFLVQAEEMSADD